MLIAIAAITAIILTAIHLYMIADEPNDINITKQDIKELSRNGFFDQDFLVKISRRFVLDEENPPMFLH